MKGKIVFLSCLFLALFSASVLAEKGFYLSGHTGVLVGIHINDFWQTQNRNFHLGIQDFFHARSDREQ